MGLGFCFCNPLGLQAFATLMIKTHSIGLGSGALTTLISGPGWTNTLFRPDYPLE